MPELPEVETVRRGLATSLTQQTITKVIVRQRNLRWPIPAVLPKILPGLTILDIQRRGKYLLFITKKGTLLIHLGMSGRLQLLREVSAPNAHDHVDILFSKQLLLRYTDPRRFGCILWTQEPPEQHKLLASLGPEPLSKQFSVDYLYQQSRGRKTCIKSFLMDSHIVVGIGNIYANEALFQAHISPFAAAGKLNLSEYKNLVASSKKVLKQAIKAGGTTLNDFFNTEGDPGYFSQKLWVYGREGQSCFNCDNTLIKAVIGQRSTVYCQHCQRVSN